MFYGTGQEGGLVHVGRCMGKQGPQSPVKNQAGIKKLAIGTWTDLNGNDLGMNNGTTAHVYGVDIPPKKLKELQKKGQKS